MQKESRQHSSWLELRAEGGGYVQKWLQFPILGGRKNDSINRNGEVGVVLILQEREVC